MGKIIKLTLYLMSLLSASRHCLRALAQTCLKVSRPPKFSREREEPLRPVSIAPLLPPSTAPHAAAFPPPAFILTHP